MFATFLGWLGGCVSCLFLFPGIPSMSNTPRIISNLGEISRNGIPLGSLLEVFPALHSSFLFLPFSFSKKHVCMFGCHWFCHVVHFLGWFGCCAKWHFTGLSPGSVPSLAFFLSISSSVFSARSMYLCFVGCWSVGLCVANG